MAETWFISDTHFFHDNLVTNPRMATHRQFSSVDDMNQTMVHNWNKVVSPADKVYHLGDVAFKTTDMERRLDALLGSLVGHKHLTVGNHDFLQKPIYAKHFQKIQYWFVFKKEKFFASHVPLTPREFRQSLAQVHGHTHEHVREEPCYLNVCVEQINYTPIHIEDVMAEFTRRGVIPT